MKALPFFCVGLIASVYAEKKTNILFIGTDQQRTSTISAYGNAFAYSPNIDRLASEVSRLSVMKQRIVVKLDDRDAVESSTCPPPIGAPSVEVDIFYL